MRFFGDMKKAGKTINSFAIVNENTDYGTSVGNAIENVAKKAGIPLAVRIPYSAKSTDVTAQVLQLKQKKPDVVIFISYTLETQESLSHEDDAVNLDYKPPMVLGDDSGMFLRPVVHSGGSRYRAGCDEFRSAWAIGKPGFGHVQNQRLVQG